LYVLTFLLVFTHTVSEKNKIIVTLAIPFSKSFLKNITEFLSVIYYLKNKLSVDIQIVDKKQTLPIQLSQQLLS